MPTRRRRTKQSRQPADEPKHTNALIHETSPYLLQHAHNPVDWHPWGPEAFALARERGVPIFLSIGYSTCYWCHVMERESFENEATAAYLNEHFVPIKVDREERPDVDEIYMAATVIMTSRGGWPMSCFLEPAHLRPFWCGTYFPDEPRPGMPSFMQVLQGMHGAWLDQREAIDEQAQRLADAVSEHLAAGQVPVAIGQAQVSQAVSVLLGSLDRAEGGFGPAPKFPQPVYLQHLMAVRQNAADDATRTAIDGAVTLTLDRMAIGGLFDQVGGGFHRYSTDGTWTVPHFEKMLYDNAQLAQVYARAAAIYDDAFYRRIVRRTLDYVLDEMTHADGGFFSAQDAEVNQREGQNYLWTPDQIRAVLDRDDAAFAIMIYGLDKGTNFQDPHHPGEPPSNVLRLSDRPDRLAATLGIAPEALDDRLDRINTALSKARQQRDQPRLDDKVIASWNGLMIAGYAAGWQLLGEDRYLKAALRASDFVLGSMVADDGTLYRAWREGAAKTAGFLEDHAAMARGLLAVHRARRDAGQLKARSKQLDAAIKLARVAAERFGDTNADATTGQPHPNGYFDTRDGQSELFVRTRITHDGAVPSGSSMMLHALIDLSELTTQGDPWTTSALGTLRSVSAALAASPISTVHATQGLLRLLTSGLGAADDAILTPAEMSETARGPMVDPAAPPSPMFSPVEVYANAEAIEVGPDHPAQVKLFLRVAPGYHILAADPGPGGAGLIPLRVHTVGGAGLRAFADYPQGVPFGPSGELRVHHESVELTVAAELGDGWAGDPHLAVTYQACSDNACLEPRTVELDVVVKRIIGAGA